MYVLDAEICEQGDQIGRSSTNLISGQFYKNFVHKTAQTFVHFYQFKSCITKLEKVCWGYILGDFFYKIIWSF
jgi:hypothetical protein